MREAVIERYLRQQIWRRGGLCLKWVSPGMRGVPDRIVLINSINGPTVAFCETKSTTGKLRPEQKRFRKKMAKLGFHVHVIASKEGARIFAKYL